MLRSCHYILGLVLLLLSGALARPSNDSPSTRIAGGSEAEEGQFPYQVALINEGLVYCGGAVLNRRWVITAAACLIGKDLSDVQLFLGSADRLAGGENVTAERFILHPAFDATTYANDIALIRLRASLFFGDNLQFIELGTDFVDEATDATFSGWGRFSISNNQLPTRLQFIRTDIIDSDECAEEFDEPYRSRIAPSTLCTRNQPDQGVCLGDAGGPLVLNGELVGVQSWSVPCGLGLPDVYQRVSHYRSWILVHILL